MVIGYDNEIDFIPMYENAMRGRTKTSFYQRGNHLIKLKDKFDQIENGIFKTSINKKELPCSLDVSWEHNLSELRNNYLNYIENTNGPYNLVSVIGHIIPLSYNEHRDDLIQIFARSLAYEFCKIRMNVSFPNVWDTVDAIQEIDECESFTYYSWGNHFYVSNKKVAFMLRVAHGMEYIDLTES